MYSNITVFEEDIKQHEDAVAEEHHLFSLAHQMTIPEFMQAPVLISCQGTGLVRIKNDDNLVEPGAP